MQFEDIHIGEIVMKEIHNAGMTKAEFGRRINTSRQNVNTLLKKKDLDTEILKKISVVLRRNFFSEFAVRQLHTPPELSFTSMRITGMEVEIKLIEEDLKAFLKWLADHKSGSREECDHL